MPFLPHSRSSDWIDPNLSQSNKDQSNRTDDYLGHIPVAYGTPMVEDAAATPYSTTRPLPAHLTGKLSESARRQLKQQGYTNGLIESLEVNKRALPVTIWVVDNSGSMAKPDGHRIVAMKNDTFKFVDCTRWSEMQQTVDYHSQMAALLHSPTTFRLLNPPGAIAGPQTFFVGHYNHHDNISATSFSDHELAVAQSVMMHTQPGGVTPLALHIQEIRTMILTELMPTLNNAKVAIVIATDGLPTDARGYSNSFVNQQFVDALRSLENLPVWVVVRLCTDEDEVVSYWNDLDSQLELSLEVLDDFAAEAQEVQDCNPWLNYCLPLHRMREMGFYHKLFDLLDERAFSKDELREFMSLLFGSAAIAEVPDPESDWKGFYETINTLLLKEKKQWNPLSKRLQPWIDMNKLKKHYGPKGFFGLF